MVETVVVVVGAVTTGVTIGVVATGGVTTGVVAAGVVVVVVVLDTSVVSLPSEASRNSFTPLPSELNT